MNDNDNIENLIRSLKEQTEIASNTYLNTTERMCETIEKLDRSKTICIIIIGVIIFFFLLFLLMLYLF